MRPRAAASAIARRWERLDWRVTIDDFWYWILGVHSPNKSKLKNQNSKIVNFFCDPMTNITNHAPITRSNGLCTRSTPLAPFASMRTTGLTSYDWRFLILDFENLNHRSVTVLVLLTNIAISSLHSEMAASNLCGSPSCLRSIIRSHICVSLNSLSEIFILWTKSLFDSALRASP